MRKYMIIDGESGRVLQSPVNILKLSEEWDIKASEVEEIVINARNSTVTVIDWEDCEGNCLIVPTK